MPLKQTQRSFPKGEPLVVFETDGSAKLYIGDGTTPFKELKPISFDMEALGALAAKDQVAESDLTPELQEKVNAASEGNHSHLNKDVLDQITSEKMAAWDAAEPNVIDEVKVNGVALPVEERAIDIAVPTNVSDLTNDLEFQTQTQVTQTVELAIAASGHATFQKSDAVPEPEAAEDNVLYLVMNVETGHYDIYAKIDGAMELLDDVAVDLDNYSTTEEMTAAITAAVANKVDKAEGQRLMTEVEAAKLTGITEGATKVTQSEVNGNILVNDEEVTVYTLPETVLQSTDTLILDGGNAA